jgi:DNA-binding transcriptional MerR regulator
VDKAPDAFRTISEVAEDLDVPQHVLRFWESRFAQIKPMKRGGGRRYYRPDDVDLLRGIRHLLYGEGYTIRGVQRILREQGGRFVQSVWRDGAPQPDRHDRAADEEDTAEAANGLDAANGAAVVDEDEPVRQAPDITPAPPRLVASAVASFAPAPARPALSEQDLQRLRKVLDELTECRRQLDAAHDGARDA